jgi:type II secretory pathway component PulF
MFGAAAARARSEVFNELASLIKAGISIGHALGALGEDMSGRQLGRTLVRMGRQVSGGDPLATAMRDQGDAFIPLTIAMIQVGEEGGRLEEALRSVAEYHERDFELRHLLTRELAYPMVLVAALILIPAIAQFVIVWLTADVGSAIAAALVRALVTLLIIGVPVGIVALILRTLSRTSVGRQRLDAIKLHIPVAGGVIRRVVMARLLRALASLYSAGVLMGTSLRLAAQACGNAVVEAELERSADKLDAGARLSEALADSPHVPKTVLRMIQTGEDTGEVDRMASNVADHYEMEAQTAIKQAAVTITPIMVVLIAVIVGVMYIGGFMRVYGM